MERQKGEIIVKLCDEDSWVSVKEPLIAPFVSIAYKWEEDNEFNGLYVVIPYDRISDLIVLLEKIQKCKNDRERERGL